MKYVLNIIFLLVSIPGWSGGTDVPLSITHGPYVQHVKGDEATIVWTTNKPCKSWVEYTEKTNKSFYIDVPRKAYFSEDGLYKVDTVHRIRITGLQANTPYVYRVLSQEVLELRPYRPLLGEIISTNILKQQLTFKTLQPEAEQISFSVFNDIHNNRERLEKLLKIAPPKDADFIVYNGDMCNYVNSQEDLFGGFLDFTISSFASEKAFVYVRGNHETRGAFARNLRPYLGGPDGKFYYSFTQGPVSFIVLDCGEDKPDTDVEYAGLIDFDSYIKEQSEWLAQALEQPEFKQAPFRIVLAHIPFTLNGWYGYERLKKYFLPLLQQAHINLMLSGHTHQFSFNDRNEQASFPVIVNANNSVLTLHGSKEKLSVKVTQEDGKVLLEKEFK